MVERFFSALNKAQNRLKIVTCVALHAGKELINKNNLKLYWRKPNVIMKFICERNFHTYV